MREFKGGLKRQGGWTAAIPAIIGAVGSIAGGLMGSRGQSAANSANMAIWRDQRQFMEEQSRTEIQRRVQDMKSAGINPMLSVMGMGAASSPNVGTPTMMNEKRDLARGMEAAAQSAMQMSQLKVMEAQARDTNASAALKEARVPFSAGSAKLEQDELRGRVDLLAKQWDSVVEGTAKTMTEAELMRQMAPLLQDYQKLLNQGEQLGLAEKKALQDLYESMKGAKGFEKFGPLILALIRAGSK